MIGTTAAILTAAAVGAGATVLASSNASKAAKSAAQGQAQGAADATAEQRRQFDIVQQETAPGREIGNAALGALGSSFGLPGYGNGAPMTGGSTADPYFGYDIAPGARGVGSTPMTDPQGAAYGDRAIAVPAGALGTGAKTGNAGTSPAAPDTGSGMIGHNGGPSMTGETPQATQTPAAQTTQAPDWNAFAAANPDVAQWAASGHGDPNVPIDQQSIEQRYAYWLQNGVKLGDPRASQPLPMKTVAAASTGTQTPTGPAAGYADPTAPNGYAVGARPDPGASPTPYVAPSLDVSLGAYQKSPGYDFSTSEAQRAISNTASANGGVYSGARLKAAGDRAVQMANQDYTDWRNFTTGQFNTDRQFDYGQSRDARGDYVTDRTRSDGLYQDDRSYMTGRYDTRNAQLMGLAGIGTGATNTSASAATSFATNAGNNIMTAANAKANGEINSANAWTSGASNLLTTGAYLGSRLMTGGGGSSGLTSYLQGAAAANPNLF